VEAMSEILDIYWTIERDMLFPELKHITYHDAATGRELGKWISNKADAVLEMEMRENKRALINSFNGLGK
jgi:hypothetical protein